jgi:hypothetical protein
MLVYMRSIFKKATVLTAVLTIAFSVVLMAVPPKASASYYSPNLIDDGKFTASTSMGVNAIQSFLIGKGSYLRSYHSTEDCYSPSGPHYAFYQAHFHCGQSLLAAQIIYDAANAYGISPKSIMATMQKEESLITDPSPSSSQLNYAMGFGCPDSSGCSGYSGFFHQVDYGTRQFRINIELSSGRSYWGYSPASYPCNGATRYYTAALKAGNNVYFKDDYGTAYTHFVIANASTAALYCYTPHVYPGSSREYYSGSYWFVYYYEKWWGPSRGGCSTTSNVAGASDGRRFLPFQYGGGAKSLVYSQQNNTGSTCAEDHVWNSGYKSWRAHIATAMAASNPSTGRLITGNWTGNNRDTQLFVKYSGGGGNVEIHKFSTNLQYFPGVYDVGTNLGGVTSSGGSFVSGDFFRSGYDHLAYVLYSGSGGQAEVHVFDRSLKKGVHYHDTLTNLSGVTSSKGMFVAGDFLGKGYDQLVYVVYSGAGGQVETHMLDSSLRGGAGYHDVLSNLSGVSAASGTFVSGDFLGRGYDQLIYVKYNGSGGKVETHMFSHDLRKATGVQDIATNLTGF